VIGKWKKLHNEQLHDWYSSDAVREMKSRRMRWKGRTGNDSDIQKFGG